MSIYRRAARRDPGEKAIIAALRSVGCSVTQLSGKGVPDLLVGAAGITYLMEVKAPLGPRGGDQTTKGQHLTEDQDAWHRSWKGAPVHIVRSPIDALRIVVTVTGEAS